MQKNKEIELNNIFNALSDYTRRDIVQRLSKGTLIASTIARPYKMSLPAISKHLKILENANLVTRTRSGRQHSFYLRPGQLERINNWMREWSKYWNMELDSLEKYLAEELDN